MNKLGYYGKNDDLYNIGIQFRNLKIKNINNIDLIKASEDISYNLDVLYKILEYNVSQNIYFYRFVIEQINGYYNILPFTKFKNYKELLLKFIKIGNYIKKYNIRLTTHPALYNILGSNKESVAISTIKRLNIYSIYMDFMGLPANDYYCINIHVGSAQDGKQVALDRFIKNFNKLYVTTKLRLVVENDDKLKLFSINDLMYLNKKINIPITFDYLHHRFNNGGLSEKEAIILAAATWKTTPKVHIVSSILNENKNSKYPRKHANFLYEIYNDYNLKLDAMIEAKLSYKALLKYRNNV